MWPGPFEPLRTYHLQGLFLLPRGCPAPDQTLLWFTLLPMDADWHPVEVQYARVPNPDGWVRVRPECSNEISLWTIHAQMWQARQILADHHE